MNTEDRLKFFAGLLSSSTDLSIWTFDLGKNFLFTTSKNEKELAYFLSISNCLEYMIKDQNDLKYPVLLSDSLDLMWISELVYDKENPICILIVGPVFCSESTVSSIERELDKKNLQDDDRKKMLNSLLEIPVIRMESIHQCAMMMHYTLYEENIRPKDIIYQKKSEQKKEIKVVEKEKLTQDEAYFIWEQRILQSVKEGSLVYQKLLDKKDNQLEFSTYISKNNIVILIGLCRNAAIEGGLSFKIAKEIEEKGILKIDESDTFGKLYYTLVETIDHFVTNIRKQNNNLTISKDIQECCNYIKSNLHETLSIEKIASAVSYSDYYLSKKFHKEMGIKLTDYIKVNKIELAKIYLSTSNKTIQEISELLQFNTRNYFDKIFREIVGVSPNNYRKNKDTLSFRIQDS